MGRKRRAGKADLDEFFEYIHSSETELTQEEYLQIVRDKIKECTKNDIKQIHTTYILEKLCEICQGYHHDEKLLLCDYCDDAFHTFCLDPPLKETPKEDEDWFCPVCIQQKLQFEKEKQVSAQKANQKVQKLLESYKFKNKNDVSSKIQICGKCDDMILVMENAGIIEESEKCVKCNKQFHKNCFNKKKDSIICTACSISIKKSIPQTQKMINEYFINSSSSDQLCGQTDRGSKKNSIRAKEISGNEDTIWDVDTLNTLKTRGKNVKSLQGTRSEGEEQQSEMKRITRLNDKYMQIKKTCNCSRSVLAKKKKKNDNSQMISNYSECQCLSSSTNSVCGDDSVTQPIMISRQASNSDSQSTTITMERFVDKKQTQELQINLSKEKVKCNSRGVRFLLPVGSSNPLVNLECKQSLIFALKAKSIQFCDELTYREGCRKEDNNGGLEPGLQVMDLWNAMIFQKFKDMTKQGIYAPVRVEEDKLQGFVVRAMEDIKSKTLLTEYVGEVDFARNHIFNKNDSIMDLLRTPRSRTSLVIVPDQKGNLARFFSGINNSSKKSKAKQNVHSIRYNIHGQSHVILFAKKNIKRGELLYYDYNAGGFGEYPTSNFI